MHWIYSSFHHGAPQTRLAKDGGGRARARGAAAPHLEPSMNLYHCRYPLTSPFLICQSFQLIGNRIPVHTDMSVNVHLIVVYIFDLKVRPIVKSVRLNCYTLLVSMLLV